MNSFKGLVNNFEAIGMCKFEESHRRSDMQLKQLCELNRNFGSKSLAIKLGYNQKTPIHCSIIWYYRFDK